MISCLRLVDLFTCYMFPLIASSKTPFLCARKCALSRRRHDRPGPLKPRLRCIPLTLVQHRPDRLRWSGLEDQGGWGMEGEVVWDAIISKMLWILRMLNDKHNCQLSWKETSAGLAWKSHMLGWKQWRLGRGGLPLGLRATQNIRAFFKLKWYTILKLKASFFMCLPFSGWIPTYRRHPPFIFHKSRTRHVPTAM